MHEKSPPSGIVRYVAGEPCTRREELLKLSQKDRDRLVVLHQVHQHQLSVCEGARRTGLGARQFRRLLRRFEREGDGAVVHGLRGRASNRRQAEEVRERALEKARQPLYHDFGPTLLSEHLGRDPEIGSVPPATLRRWMIAAGLWKPAPQGERHRRRRGGGGGGAAGGGRGARPAPPLEGG